MHPNLERLRAREDEERCTVVLRTQRCIRPANPPHGHVFVGSSDYQTDDAPKVHQQLD